ncbi:CAP domain-containing protein [Ramlibacter algicola]|uniref:CAP domain-containing protein n=1 Tax=Ramlibacter algicola TaxID=2795217 RepID=A0A934PZ35_9BURK|nr:CAP domain-containing protein [Ramlibacter algicola]MBK0392038.1 CAP domain-containing protein [Ramlibacter algicola]
MRLLLLLILAVLAASARADEAFDAVLQARRQCAASAPPLQRNAQLDDAARRLADGTRLPDALKASGYRALRSFEWQLSGYPNAQAVARELGSRHCSQLGTQGLAEAGVHRAGKSWWVIAAVPFAPPAAAQSGDVAGRVLALVNQARTQSRRCGSRSFGPANALRLDPALGRAALVHAQAMAQGNFLAHEGRDGSTPAERATKAGYDWRSVGENVASGQTTPERVVQDWLESPEHCANIMDPGYMHMGVAFAVDRGSEGGIYWAQEFGRPWSASR